MVALGCRRCRHETCKTIEHWSKSRPGVEHHESQLLMFCPFTSSLLCDFVTSSCAICVIYSVWYRYPTLWSHLLSFPHLFVHLRQWSRNAEWAERKGSAVHRCEPRWGGKAPGFIADPCQAFNLDGSFYSFISQHMDLQIS